MGGRRGVFAGFVGLVVVAAGVLSGCSSGAQGASGPDVGPRVSSTLPAVGASPSPTSSATASLDAYARDRIPKAARAHTAQGAEAFARFYLEQVNKAWMVPDPEQIRPYALASCKTCANYVATAEWLHDERLHYRGAPSTIGPSGVLPESSHNTVYVQIVQVQEPQAIFHENNSVEERLDKDASLLEIRLPWRHDSWVIGSIKGSKAS